MLILTRTIGQSLMIGDDVTVTVLGIKGNQVRVGFTAPRSVCVDREEVYERKKMDARGSRKQTEQSEQTEPEQSERSEQTSDVGSQ